MILSSLSLALLAAAAVLLPAHAQFDVRFNAMTKVDHVKDVNLQIPEQTEQTNHLLNVYALPVGQGDCTIIQCPNGNLVVVDCGSSGGLGLQPPQIKDFLQNQMEKVVAIVVTHPDRNHFNYIDKIEWIPSTINQVIIGGSLDDYNGRMQDYARFYKWLTKMNSDGKLHKVNDGQPCVGNCAVPKGTDFCDSHRISFNILAANVEGSSSNEKSIVMKVTAGRWSMLLPGGMEGKAARVVAKELGPQLNSVVYKMAEHGDSDQANNLIWLDPIKPQMAFASSAYNHQPEKSLHPRCNTVARLHNLQTIGYAERHPFHCGNGEALEPTQYDDFSYNIFETSPTPNTICILVYHSSGEQSFECYKMSDTTFERGWPFKADSGEEGGLNMIDEKHCLVPSQNGCQHKTKKSF